MCLRSAHPLPLDRSKTRNQSLSTSKNTSIVDTKHRVGGTRSGDERNNFPTRVYRYSFCEKVSLNRALETIYIYLLHDTNIVRFDFQWRAKPAALLLDSRRLISHHRRFISLRTRRFIGWHFAAYSSSKTNNFTIVIRLGSNGRPRIDD